MVRLIATVMERTLQNIDKKVETHPMFIVAAISAGLRVGLFIPEPYMGLGDLARPLGLSFAYMDGK